MRPTDFWPIWAMRFLMPVDCGIFVISITVRAISDR
jgi:hypothetical protein